MNEREIVLNMLLRNGEGTPSHIVLRECLENYAYLEKASRAFITRLFEGSIEKRIYIDFIIRSFSKMPLKKMKPLIRFILELSVYQLMFMDKVPDHAAINEAVKLVKKRGFSSLSGFVNGILRSISRGKDTLDLPKKEVDLKKYLEIKYSMPSFLVKRFLHDYGEEAEAIMKVFDNVGDMTIRVNTEKTDRLTLLRSLKEEGIKAVPSSLLEHSIHIKEMDSLDLISGFEDGEFFVQDESSQIAALLAGVKKGNRVLDLCAAPGGKTFVMAFCAGESGSVIACDLTDYKLSLLQENIQRLSIKNVSTLKRDAQIFQSEFQDYADVVLCDLPCSGLGVIAGKKDIKFQVSDERIQALSKIQKEILQHAVKYVKIGGILLFSTCTMTKEENEENVLFLSEMEGLQLVDFSSELPSGFKESPYASVLCEEARRGYLRILPHYFQSDGFFISKFIRIK